MKRLAMISIFLLCAVLSAGVIYTEQNRSIEISLQNEGNLDLDGNYFYQNIAFPAENVSLEIIGGEVSYYDGSGNEIERRNGLVSERVQLTESLVMREMIMHRIKIKVNEESGSRQSVINNVQFRLNAESEIKHFSGVSQAFVPVYKDMADNYETSYLRNLSIQPSRMLIISHNELQNLEYFTIWKNERGIETDIAMMSDIGSTAVQLKDYLQELYDTEEVPYDYLLLIGDVNGSFIIPSFYHSAENDVTDHPYTLLAGDDYLPEMIVGRMSIDQQIDLDTIIMKTLNYEKTPYMTNPDWFDDILLVAGNYSDTPPPPTTPVTTTMWLADKVEEYGYDDITEVYYWPPEFIAYPGTSEIMDAINNGVGIVAYRGWGNAWGWNYPYFHTENILDLSNGFYLPVMTSIVCNTGDFANANVDPCFGELWVTAGSATAPKGGVAFVGPSDLHTKTKYNNAIFSGFYQGLLDEGIHDFGTAVLRGKAELYKNFPNEHETGADVEFYYYVYNILGDPSLNIWTRIPQEMTCDLPSEIGIGQSYLDFYVPETSDGMVTVYKEDEFIVSDYIIDHNATLFFSPESEGTITVTITADNYLPYIQDIEIVTNEVEPVITEITPQSEVLAEEQTAIDITLTNLGSETASFTAMISEENGLAEVLEEEIDFGTLASGSSSTQTFNIEVVPDCLPGSQLSFHMTFADLEHEIKFALDVINFHIEPLSVNVNDANGVLEPGETSQIAVELWNIGSLDVSGLTAEIVSATTSITVPNATDEVGSIPAGSSAEAFFELSAAPDAFNGRQAHIYLHLEDADGRTYNTMFMLTIGIVDNTDPTGPSLNGYYAYDSYDTEYAESPEYFWQEIDPEQGGPGEVILLEDDEITELSLPFDFTFFNKTYDSVTASSNGWLSFETNSVYQTFFRNWLIPAALGPKAMIAGYWDDLLGPGGTEPLRLCYYYDQTEHKYIVEWSNAVNRQDNSSPEIFQIVLYDPMYHNTESGNGIIQVNYQDVNNPDYDDNFCTVGIEDSHHLDGILYTFASIYPESATPLQAGLAIKYTTEAPDDYTTAENGELATAVPVLKGNYPNPFNPETTIALSLPEEEEIELSIYNIKGEKVKTLLNEKKTAGEHQVIWNGQSDYGETVSSGIYFYQLKTKTHSSTGRCLLMK